MADLIVEVEQGQLQGKVSVTDTKFQYYTFKGIPFAKPPINELRFCPPQPPEPWTEIRDATRNCNICAQLDKETNSTIGDEDCLFLNVYTPKLPTAGSTLRPVMVFFHGGGFVFGHGTDDTGHGPDTLIEKDVVIVGINYRLGVLGFLCLDRKEAPGNMGLMDQVQALKWIQKNIANFGGDPKNVTIFGVSAGGASVEYLLLSPMAKGLFHKAIAQSGSSLLHWATNTKIKKLAFKLPEALGTNITDENELLEYLKKLSTNDLVVASLSVLAKDEFRGGIHFGFVPTVEKSGDWEPFLNKNPYQLLKRGEFNKVPFISGFCTREGLLMVSHAAPKLKNFLQDNAFINYFPFDLDDAEKVETELKLKSTYSGDKSLFEDKDAYAIDFFTDVDFLGGVYVASKFIAKHNKFPVYFYEFSYDGNLNYIKKCYNIERKGACHGDEGGYLLKSYKLTGPITATDELIKNKMNTMWTNFAKCGNPTPQLDDVISTKWDPIPQTGVACLVIDKTTEMKNEVYPERMKIYEEFYEKKCSAK